MTWRRWTGRTRASAITIEAGERRYLIGVKLDLERELVRDWRRPMYTYESGKTRTVSSKQTDISSLQRRKRLFHIR